MRHLNLQTVLTMLLLAECCGPWAQAAKEARIAVSTIEYLHPHKEDSEIIPPAEQIPLFIELQDRRFEYLRTLSEFEEGQSIIGSFPAWVRNLLFQSPPLSDEEILSEFKLRRHWYNLKNLISDAEALSEQADLPIELAEKTDAFLAETKRIHLKLVQSNYGIIFLVLKRLFPRNQEMWDFFFTPGFFALWDSVLLHNPYVSRFSSYAFHTIRNEILKDSGIFYITNNIPEGLLLLKGRLHSRNMNRAKSNLPPLEADEIAEEFSTTLSRAKNSQVLRARFAKNSLDNETLRKHLERSDRNLSYSSQAKQVKSRKQRWQDMENFLMSFLGKGINLTDVEAFLRHYRDDEMLKDIGESLEPPKSQQLVSNRKLTVEKFLRRSAKGCELVVALADPSDPSEFLDQIPGLLEKSGKTDGPNVLPIGLPKKFTPAVTDNFQSID